MISEQIKTAIASVIFLLIAGMFTAIVWLAYSRMDIKKDNAELQNKVTLAQAALRISEDTQTAFSTTEGEVHDRNQTAQANAESRRVEIRTVYKTVRIANECLPAGVTDRLYSNALRLRSAAMHPNQPVTDSANTNTPPGTCLTYENAVIWIDQLLTALETANNDKAGIREQERSRQTIYSKTTGSK